ncbi:sensor histidine kinase [Amycolatopsis sp. NPDC059657]|uniref:sensor histidine kinase n=1 Tax=Amycolatopsis sp. NPDC059657 TaxID=3346899 RepID=UPI0036725782
MVGDSLIAVLLSIMTLPVLAVDVTSEDPSVQHPYLAVPMSIIAVLPLVFRRKYPLASAYAVLLLSIPDALIGVGIGSAFGTGIAVYSVLVYTGRRHGALYLVAVLLVSWGQLLLEPVPDKGIWAFVIAICLALCWVLGEFVGARHAYQREVEARLHLLENERDQATKLAVGEERGRIARELHDVVAHAVSVMVVQADGASYAIKSNPELAGRALATISDTGRGALAELRRLLDVLRNEDGDAEPRVPQPKAEALVELTERVRASGLPVDMELGELGDLPAGVSLGVYRIVQESLTNALKHAGRGAKACVKVERTGDLVTVEVTDDGAGTLVSARAPVGGRPVTGGGNGLIGMRERAHVFGGTLDVGPAPGGGWRVFAKLPVRLAS